MQISNMFNTGSRLTGMESVVESVHSGLESAADSVTNLLRIGLWVRAFKSQNSQKLLRALTQLVCIFMIIFIFPYLVLLSRILHKCCYLSLIQFVIYHANILGHFANS